jgi:bacterioferritin (cytochrome b1)
MYNEAAVICASEKDQKSKDLFEEFLSDEQGHLNFFENFRDYVDKLGEAYIATLTGK